jgi:hypothetical protein
MELYSRALLPLTQCSTCVVYMLLLYITVHYALESNQAKPRDLVPA